MEVKMKVTIQKLRNSDEIRISGSILSLNIKTNDILDIEQKDDKIVISIPKKKEIFLEERFKNYYGDNLSKKFSWDEPAGKELW